MKRVLLTLLLLTGIAACDKEKKETYPEFEKWKTYTLNNSALINDYVNCVAVDSDDHIWAGNYYGDMTEFDGAEWTHHVTKDSGIFHNTINKIVIDHENMVWAASSYGLFHLGNSVWTGSIPPVDPMYSFTGINDIAVGADNSIWVCARPLWRYHTESSSSYSWEPYSYSYRIAVAPNGNLWISSGSQMICFDGINFTFNSGQYFNTILTVAVSKTNIPWIGTYYSGLASYDGSAWIFYNAENSGLPSNYIRAIAFDKDDHLWIGTDNGLAHFDGTHWTVYNTENSGLLSNYITGIAFDSRNKVWISTYGGGLSEFSPNGL